MKKIIVSVVFLVGIFSQLCLFGQGKTTLEYNLPDTFPKITDTSYFEKTIAKFIGPYFDGYVPDSNIQVYIHSDGRTVLKVNISDKIIESKVYWGRSGKTTPILNLSIPKLYCEILHDWFYKSILTDETIKQQDIDSLDIVYAFEYQNERGKIQIQGVPGKVYDSWYKQYVSAMIISRPVFVECKGNADKLYDGATPPDAQKDNTTLFLTKPYNPLTEKYSASYLVYYLFGVDDLIKDVPPMDGMIVFTSTPMVIQ